ncbi:MAG: regulator of molybdate uptake, partial [Deltaproteobacteria bacterium]|nr:regulator of molybdate uptake [Deltaproteobacteria bacterium]
PGSGAQRLLERAARQQGLPLERARHPPLRVRGHLDVARAVLMGAADTGVATRDAALAFGLAFVPLADERYDLALPRASLGDARVQRLLDVLVSSELRRELEALGYDTRPAGQRAAELVGA